MGWLDRYQTNPPADLRALGGVPGVSEPWPRWLANITSDVEEPGECEDSTCVICFGDGEALWTDDDGYGGDGRWWVIDPITGDQ